MAVGIRKATKKDMGAIVKIWIALMDFHKPFGRKMYQFKPNYAALYQKFLKKQLSSGKAAVFVAQDKRKIIWYLMVDEEKLPPIYIFDKEAFVSDLFVKGSYRGKGIGTRLIGEAEKWGKTRKCHWLGIRSHVRNRRAINVYRQSGMQAHHLKLSKFLG